MEMLVEGEGVGRSWKGGVSEMPCLTGEGIR